MIGGPPCQGFSPLNRDGVGLERRALWREYLRALDEAAPSAFVMENVPELLRRAEYEEFKRGRRDARLPRRGRTSSTPPTTASRSAAGARS